MLTERFELRFTKELLARLDRWRGKQASPPPRAEAIRALLEKALDAEGIAKAVAKKSRDKA